MCKRKIEELHAAEKLIIFYALNLFLLHENDNAMHLIQNSGYKIKGSALFEANLRRIEGLIYYNKSEINLSIECFKKAKVLYI